MADPTYHALARAAAQRLEAMSPGLPAHVEAVIDGAGKGAPPRYDPATALALASFLLSATSFGWQVYRDLRKDAQAALPSAEVITRRLRIVIERNEIEIPSKGNQVIEAVVEELILRERNSSAGTPS